MATTLSAAGMPVTTLEPVGTGRVSWTYLADGEWIVQIPRFDSAAESMRIQARIMPLVRDSVPFAVPVPEPVAEHEGHPVLRYRRIAGRALRATDQLDAVAATLRSLHEVPRDRAAAVLRHEPTVEAWRSGHVRFRDLLEHALLDRLDAPLREAITNEYEGFLTEAFDFTPTFVHSDLGAEHILVDPGTGRPRGVIDFDWASIGDPAIDFAGLLNSLGPHATKRILEHYGNAISRERLLFYWWLTPCYGLVYAGEYLDEHATRRGVAELRGRLSRLAAIREQVRR